LIKIKKRDRVENQKNSTKITAKNGLMTLSHD